MPFRSLTSAVRRFADDTRGALMPEYLVVTALSLAIAAAVGAMSIVLDDSNEAALDAIHSELP